MNDQLTRNQHQVPRFYLNHWADGQKQVYLYDLNNRTRRRRGTKKILSLDYYYEEDPVNPDNRIENILGSIEDECAPVLRQIHDLTDQYRFPSQMNKLKTSLKAILFDGSISVLKKFAAFQYLRIPGAIEQKVFELQGTMLSRSQIDHQLNPGRFVESGYAYLKECFENLTMLVQVSFETDFLTSDWPCFDLKDSDLAPALGEEIGRSKDVYACMPLTPRVRAIFCKAEALTKIGITISPGSLINTCPTSQVKNQNALTIQQCIRYVVSRSDENYILTVAGKRKRNQIF